MDYYKIKKCIRDYLEQNNERISDRAEARVILMSQKGYLAMMEHHTLTVKKLEEIAKKFNKPVSYFFVDEESEPLAVVNEVRQEYKITRVDCPECISKLQKIEELEEYRRKYIECLEELAGKKKAG